MLGTLAVSELNTIFYKKWFFGTIINNNIIKEYQDCPRPEIHIWQKESMESTANGVVGNIYVYLRFFKWL